MTTRQPFSARHSYPDVGGGSSNGADILTGKTTANGTIISIPLTPPQAITVIVVTTARSITAGDLSDKPRSFYTIFTAEVVGAGPTQVFAQSDLLTPNGQGDASLVALSVGSAVSGSNLLVTVNQGAFVGTVSWVSTAYIYRN